MSVMTRPRDHRSDYWRATRKQKEAFTNRWKRDLHETRGRVETIDLPDASRYIFLSNEAEVLRGVRAFLANLRAR